MQSGRKSLEEPGRRSRPRSLGLQLWLGGQKKCSHCSKPASEFSGDNSFHSQDRKSVVQGKKQQAKVADRVTWKTWKHEDQDCCSQMANGSLPYIAFEQLMDPKIDKSATDAERKEITRRAWEKKSTKVTRSATLAWRAKEVLTLLKACVRVLWGQQFSQSRSEERRAGKEATSQSCRPSDMENMEA